MRVPVLSGILKRVFDVCGVRYAATVPICSQGHWGKPWAPSCSHFCTGMWPGFLESGICMYVYTTYYQWKAAAFKAAAWMVHVYTYMYQWKAAASEVAGWYIPVQWKAAASEVAGWYIRTSGRLQHPSLLDGIYVPVEGCSNRACWIVYTCTYIPVEGCHIQSC